MVGGFELKLRLDSLREYLSNVYDGKVEIRYVGKLGERERKPVEEELKGFGYGVPYLIEFLVNGEPGDPSGLTFCKPGDVVAFYSAGGGGYGDPFERDPEMVRRDVIYGYVSVEQAREDYGVVIDPETFEIDYKATERMRSGR